MPNDGIVLRFENVSFEYGHNKPILDQVSFSVRRGMKVTLMGQNGAGKSTLFQLIMKTAQPDQGRVLVSERMTVAIASQVIPRDQLDLTVRDFFKKQFSVPVYDIDPRIDAVLDIVHLKDTSYDKTMRQFSGGQQARLLLASALIQEPDVLLLDEPTNNLDTYGIEHLTDFLKSYSKTVIVISHDAEFLNSFTQGVLYLDVKTKKIEQYNGNYHDVTREITARIEKENRKNAQLAKQIQENKDKSNFFANKGGGMRLVAKRMREKAAEMEEELVEVRTEDRTIKEFEIPFQRDLGGEFGLIESVTVLKKGKPTQKKLELALRKNTHIRLMGPNGIGKSTLLESIVNGKATGVKVDRSVKIGYYRQDFSMLDFNQTVFDSLMSVMDHKNEERMRMVAAGFLITGEVVRTRIGGLSEGQKGLVAFARLVLEKPGLLILDEPTNHINFRHIPVIAKALDSYEGAMIVVSHVEDFIAQIRIDRTIELG